MKKKPAKAAKTTVPRRGNAESASSMASDIYETALAGIRAEVEGLHNGTKKSPKRYHPVDRIAYLAKQASVFAAEARKERSAAIASTRKLTPELVELWLREQTPEYRAHLVRELVEMDSDERRSVLG